MIDPKLTYAVIWASNNVQKYWYKVFKNLIDKWFKAIAINPNEKKIYWQKSYSSLWEFDWKIDLAIFVLPAKFSLAILKDAKKLLIKKVWFQPWAESDELIKYCEKNNIEYIANACIMIQS